MEWSNFAALAAEFINPKTGRTYPGKYEGESLLTPYFHAASGDGWGEILTTQGDGESGTYCELAEITGEDRAFFAGTDCEIPDGAAYAVISESDQGFAGCYLCTEAEADTLRAECDSDDDILKPE